jgi:glycosyltransferase involved in cell wall biosynthesis
VSDYDGIQPYRVKGVSDDTFMFYSIFQWTERKHPLAMIKAYWHAFQNNEDVALVLKTYRSDYSDQEKEAIRTTIRRLKAVTPMDKYPPIYVIPNMLSNDEILGLHARGDCYVSLDRGEGFGLSPFAAGAAGNPIIVTGFGGTTEYAKPDNSYLVDYNLTPVFGIPWSPWYRGDQLWAEPAVKHGSNLMKNVFENQEGAIARGKKLQESIKENFSWKRIGERIIENLESL